jgi:hypothetical protein
MKTVRWVIAAAVVLLLVAGGIATWNVRAERTDAPTSQLHERPECGHEWRDSVKVVQISDIIDVPEFHDCQRFIVRDGATYKYIALFAIFVSQTIRTLEPRLGPAQPVPAVQPPGGVTTTVVPGVGSNTPPAPWINTLTAGMVAVVFAEGPYAPLGIQTGLNCLYVWRYVNPQSPQQTETWSARMVPKGTEKNCPDATVGTIGNGKDLKVSRTQVAGFTDPNDYPPVTRWDWDRTHEKQYVGVTCGVAWCEIYDDQLDPSPPLPVTGSDPVGVRRVRLIKGWYDQQFVATTDANKNVVPSRIMGTIVPDSMLGKKADDDFKNKWVYVATVSLDATASSEDAALNVYKDKFNFVKTSITDPATLELKWTPGKQYWKARITRPGPFGWLTRKHKNVMRRPYGGAPGTYEVPGVARWRWMTTDEGSWTRCTGGCCEMSDY